MKSKVSGEISEILVLKLNDDFLIEKSVLHRGDRFDYSDGEMIGQSLSDFIDKAAFAKIRLWSAVKREAFDVDKIAGDWKAKSGEWFGCNFEIAASQDETAGKIGRELMITPLLRESRTVEYRQLIESIGECAIICVNSENGESFTVTDCNKPAFAAAKKKQQKIIGASVEELFPDFGLTEIMQRASGTGETATFPDKNLSQIGLRGKAIPAGQNKIILIYSENTERSRGRRAQDEHRDFFLSLYESNQEIMVLVNPEDGSIIDANPSALRFYGISRKKMKTMKIHDFNTLSFEELKPLLDDAKGTHQNYFVFQHRMMNGVIRDVEIFITPIRYQGRTILHSIIHDISERRKKETDLATVQNRYEELAENISDIFFALDREFRIMYWNLAVEAFTKLKAKEVLGKSIFEMFPDFLDSSIEKAFRKVMVSAQSRTILYTHSLDSEEFIFEYNIYPSSEGIIIFAKNVTERMKMFRELMMTNRYLMLLSECSQALAYSATEIDYINRICQIINEKGGYRLVWVGRLAPNDPSLVVPIVAAGVESYHIHQSEVRIDHTPNADDPITNAYFNNNCAIFQSMKDRKNLPIWLINSIRWNLLSMIVFPLLDGDKVFGFLCLHSEEANHFQQTELVYLNDIAANVVHGILSFRLREKQQELSHSLQESEMKYRNLMNQASDAIFLFDFKGYLIEMNQKAQEIIGENAHDMFGINFMHTEKWQRYISDYSKMREMFLMMINQGVMSGEVPEIVLSTPDGGHVYLEMTASVIEYSDTRWIQAICRNISVRKESETKIMLYQQKLRDLAYELTLTEEKERQRIATELHDSVVQYLAVSKINLGLLKRSLNTEEQFDLWQKIHQHIEESIRVTRTMLFELSPPILYELGFEAAIDWLADQFESGYSIKIEVVAADQKFDTTVDTGILLFQMVRELLMNVIKHSRAKKARVILKENDGYFEVEVSDDGIGFPKDEPMKIVPMQKGFGLFSIRERISQIGGNLTILPGEAGGTCVIISVPIEKKERNAIPDLK